MTYPALCQIEIPVSDLRRSEKFYSEVLGWRFVPAEILNYSVVEVEPESSFGIALVGGFPKNTSRGTAPIAYFKCQGLAELQEKLVDSGGSLMPSRRTLPGGGSISIMVDPDGNKIGLYVPAERN